MRTPVSSLAALLAGASLVQAQQTIHVNGACGDNAWSGASPVCAAPDGPKQTIKAAIAAAVNDDSVLVADGVYSGTGNTGISFGGKRIVLRSANGPDACVIDALGVARAFTMADNLTPDTLIDGFTIRNGGSTGSGGAFWFHHQNNPTIRNCIITANAASQGGAVHTETNADPTFINCTFTGNTAVRGGAFSITGASRPKIINCVIAGNAATDQAGALYIQMFNAPGPQIINCTIAGNTAANTGGAMAVLAGSVALRNSVVWNNTAPAGAQLAVGSTGGSPGTISVAHSIVQGGRAGVLIQGVGVLTWLLGNSTMDPTFAAPGAGNFRLAPGSPAIDASDNLALPPGIVTDRDGKPRFVDDPATPDTGLPGGAGGEYIADMGAYEFQGCYPDCNADGNLTVADFGCFQTAYVLAHAYADCNQSGTLTVADFGCFQGAYVLACP
ncbi:MAG: right-handed parallel beta-helix repeat-containing protein [Phycisphaerales bacterium]